MATFISCGVCLSVFPEGYRHECSQPYVPCRPPFTGPTIAEEVEQRTANAIADWLEREYRTIGPDVAAEIRAGKWRHPETTEGAREHGQEGRG